MNLQKNMKYVEEEITLVEFADRFLNLNDMTTPANYDISDLEIEVLSKDNEFKPLTNFVVKEGVNHYYKLNDLSATSQHKVFYNDEFILAKDHPDAIKVDEPMDVVDISVAETECYVANGYLNHNTTPGGKAIPFHASVRIMITSSAPIKNDEGEIIGITVRATVKKNKVGPPMRKVEFDIIFGEGINESESLFSLLKKASSKEPIVVGDKAITLADSKSWKKLILTDPETGEVLIEKSFVKSKFQELLNDETYGQLLLDAIDQVLTIKYDDKKQIEGEATESTNEEAVGTEEFEE